MRPKRPLLSLGVGLTLALVALAPAMPGDPDVGKSYKVPYRLTATNHFLVRVRLNGKGPFNFLVDTGAPALYVGTEAAKIAGLEPAKDGFWTPLKRLDFEGGASLKDVKARIEDPFQLIGMNALGLPGASIDGILGFTMLARFKIEIDPTADRMVWTRLDYEPKEPFVPRGQIAKNAPAEVEAMNLLGPVAKFAAALIGKQEPDKHIPRGRLGVTLDAAAKVASVLEGSPAAQAGLKAGDVLVKVNSKAVDSTKAALAAAAEIRPGAKIPLTVRRDGRTLELTAIAGEGF
jgi:PDZ domain/Aspartyl protease